MLNLYEKYLLFFTADGFVVSQEADWCTAGVCPNLTSASDSKGLTKENVTEISDLWNHSRVVGLSRVDVSARYHNPFTHMQFILLIQKDVRSTAHCLISTCLLFGYSPDYRPLVPHRQSGDSSPGLLR